MTDKLLKPVLLILALLNMIDYGFTMRAVYVLGIPEANPFMDMALGTPLFAVVKLLVVPAFCLLLWLIRDRWQDKVYIGGLLSAVFVAYSGVTVWHLWGQFFM